MTSIVSVDIPELVLEAFPILRGRVPIRQLASPVPLVPDTTFDIFPTGDQGFFALVTTDYADPSRQSRELRSISGSHEFVFESLQKPFDEGSRVLPLESDSFFVSTPYRNHRLYYYIANLKTSSPG